MKNKDKKEKSQVLQHKEDEQPTSLRDYMNKFFEESFTDPLALFHRVTPHHTISLVFPKIDVSEDEKQVKVVANVPGVEPDEIELDVADHTLIIAGKTEKVHEERNEKFYRYEREYGDFRREVPLPARVKDDKISAKIKNGVLTITLPKEEESAKKKIKVEVEK